MDRMKIAVYSFDRPEHACGYIRIVSPLEAIEKYVDYAWGVSYRQNPLFKQKIVHGGYVDFADLIIVQRIFPQKRTEKVLEKIIGSGKPVIYDIDDLLIDLPHDHLYKDFIDKCRPFIIEFIRQVDAVTVSTSALGEALKEYNANIHVLPNLVDDDLWHGGNKSVSDRVVVGFGGTMTHGKDIAFVEEALLAIAEKYRGVVTFKFLGCVTESLARLDCVEYIDFRHSYRDYAKVLQQAGIDIAIVPLVDNLFNRCKSNIKWLEYSACGIPGVYSDLLPYSSCVKRSETGLLAGNSSKEWFEALDLLVSNQEIRRSIGIAARADVLANYSLGGHASIYADFYRSVVRGQQSPRGEGIPLAGRILKSLRRSPFDRR